MKTKLTLLFTLLAFCVSGVWAETITLVTAADTWSGGTFFKTTGSAISGWGHTYLSDASSTQPQVFINSNNAAESSGGFNCANGRHGTGKTFYLNIQPGYKITGYSISFKSAGESTTTITAADGKTSKTADKNTAQILNVTGLSTLNTTYSVSGSDNAIITAYTITYEAIDAAKYRLMQCWNNNSNYFYYCYSTSSNKTIMYEHSSPTGINKMDPYYVWAAHNDTYKLKLENMGSGYYVKQFTGTSSNYELLTNGTAEKMKIACNYNYGNYYTLQSTSSASASYIDSYGSGDGSRVNIHNALHQGNIFKFIPVKTVNFVNTSSVAQAITVTASDATSGSYSTIYVAMDGSDSFTLPSSYQYSFDNGENYVYASEAATTIAGAGTSDMTVMVKTNTSATVEYHIYFDNSKVTSLDNVSNYAGDAPSVPSSLVRACCNYKYYTTSSRDEELETITAETKDVYVDCTWDGPFEISVDFGSAKWYYMTLRGYWVLYAEDTPWYFTSSQSKEDIAKWAFIGNPYDGFKIINKEAGSGKYLHSTGTGSSNYPEMSATETNWTLGTHPYSGYYTFYYGTNNHLYAGSANSQVWLRVLTATLTTDNDSSKGGGFTFEAVPDNFYDYVASNVTPFVTATNSYFHLNTSTGGYSAFNTLYTTVVEEESCTESEYTTLYTYISTIGNYNLPPTGYYRFKNNMYQTYYQNASSTSLNGVEDNTSAGTIVYLTNNGDNTFTMQMQGSYVQTPTKSGTVTLSASSVNFTPSVGAAGWASFNAGGGQYGCLHMDNSKSVVGWEASGIANNSASYWAVEDATSFTGTLTNAKDNTGTEHSYATLCVPFAISALTGADAYTPSKSGDYLIPGDAATVSDGTLIPAGTPVLLIGAKDAGTYTATIKTGTSPVANPATPASTNVLTGTFAGTTISTNAGSTNYVLGKDRDNENRIGFYHYDSESYNLKANRAYLNTNAVSVKGFILMFDEDDETSIHSIDNGQLTIDNAAIYNLAGQRVSKAQKGIYIVNGKKVLF